MALDYDDAVAELSDMVASSTDPALSAAELRRLLRIAQVADADKHEPDTYGVWAGSAAWAINRTVTPTARNGYAYRVTTAGTSGASEPTWPTTIGQTVSDGTVTWTCLEVALWTPSYDRMALNLAASEGWRRKAAKLTDNEAFSADGAFLQPQLRRGDMLEMADRYRRKYVGSPALVGRVRQGIDDPDVPSDAELIDDLLWQHRVVNR
jgi:hypothetical protein